MKDRGEKKVKCETCQDKAFYNWGANRCHFTFPNGNHISVIWGYGSYSENHDKFPSEADIKSGAFDRHQFMGSGTCEVMFDAPEKLTKSVLRHFKESNQPLGYLTMEQFVWLFNKLSKDSL